jgi:tripartite ATP-independent transporter DctP family solute receptor
MYRITRGLAASLIALLSAGLVAGAAAPTWAQVVLRAGHNQIPEYPHGKIIVYFADKVAERSKGTLKVQVFHQGTLGQERELFEGMRLGTVDMAKTITSVIGNTVPEFGIFDLPYLFRDLDHQLQVLNGPVGTQLLAKLEGAGIKGLFWMEQGTRSFYLAKKPVRNPADLKGMKIRVMESPIMVDTINTLGAAATPMPWGELYTSLRQGVVDGAENAPDAIYTAKQYEVTKFYALTDHFRTPTLFMISLRTWNRLSEAHRQVILDASKDAAEWGKNLYSQEAAEYLKKLKVAGMEVIEVDREAFRKAVEPVYQKHAGKFGWDLVRSIRGY